MKFRLTTLKYSEIDFGKFLSTQHYLSNETCLGYEDFGYHVTSNESINIH